MAHPTECHLLTIGQARQSNIKANLIDIFGSRVWFNVSLKERRIAK